jgi:hypothetical protein
MDRGDRQIPGVPRRPHFEGREWGKPQARCSGRHGDDDPARKTSRGNDGGCLTDENNNQVI